MLESCFKDGEGICPTEKFSFERIDYTGNEIRTEGFYYGNSFNTLSSDDTIYEIFFLFKNGVILNAGGAEYENMTSYIEVLRSSGSIYESKKDWGLFKIENGIVTFNQLIPRQCGIWMRERTGVVLNDSTMLLTEEIIHMKNETTIETINDTFCFYPYSAKPDSTNQFLD